ncbi:unnamed protein product [Toxocara canis]|uniref:F-box domain-containing protein n=1 Tax=Toxocara canis TaxID=6265 RepID=A0A183TZP8_TOXCA|nr:unnamed protein product [Toxocara canis]
MVKLDELPLTVLMKIFECVPDPNDVCNLSEVCRLFDQLITDHPHKLSKFAVDKFDVHVRYTWNGLVRVSLIAFRNDGKGHHPPETLKVGVKSCDSTPPNLGRDFGNLEASEIRGSPKWGGGGEVA